MIRKVCDFLTLEEKARLMSDEELAYARKDARETAEVLDASDRVNGTDLAGYYRDEASVYAREQAVRVATN